MASPPLSAGCPDACGAELRAKTRKLVAAGDAAATREQLVAAASTASSRARRKSTGSLVPEVAEVADAW
jgi:hypothetical protein